MTIKCYVLLKFNLFATNLPLFILNQNLIHMLSRIMMLKVVFISMLNLLVALAVNSANASPSDEFKYLI